MFPLVGELAEDGIPVTVTCRVLCLCRQQYYRWLKEPISEHQRNRANVADVVFDAHRDDPEFGYRFLADEARRAGSMCVIGQCGRSVQRTAGGRCSAKRSLVRPAALELLHMTIWFVVFSLRHDRTNCGSPT